MPPPTHSTAPAGTAATADPSGGAGEERRIDAKIVACLLGGTLLVASLLSRLLFQGPWHPDALAVVAAALLGAPIVLDGAASLLGRLERAGRRSHLQELVALAVLASFASGQYLESGAIAFFMLIASFIEDRTAVGARRTIESLIRLGNIACKRDFLEEGLRLEDLGLDALDKQQIMTLLREG